MKNKAGSIVGIATGVALGILFFTWCISFVSSWLIVLFPFFIFVLLLLAFAGARIGGKSDKKVPVWLPYVIVLLGWPMALYLPPTIRFIPMDAFSQSLPDYPGATLVETRFFDGSGTNKTMYDKKYRTEASAQEVISFYKAELTKMGCVQDGKEHDNYYACKRGGDSFSITVNPTYVYVAPDSNGHVFYGDDDIDPSTREIKVYGSKG